MIHVIKEALDVDGKKGRDKTLALGLINIVGK